MKPYGNQEKYEKGKEAGEYKDNIAFAYLNAARYSVPASHLAGITSED